MSIIYKKPLLFVLWLVIVSSVSSLVTMMLIGGSSSTVEQQMPETYVVGTEKASMKLGSDKTQIRQNEEVRITVDVTTTGEDVQTIMASIDWDRNDFAFVSAEPQLTDPVQFLSYNSAGNVLLLHYIPETEGSIQISANTQKRIFILKLKALKNYPTSRVVLNTSDDNSSVLFVGSSANGLDLTQSPNTSIQFSAASATATATAGSNPTATATVRPTATATAGSNPTATATVRPTATATSTVPGENRTVRLQVLFKGVEAENVNFNSLVAIRTSPDLVTTEKIVLVNDTPVKFVSGGKPAGKDWALFTSDPITVPTNGYSGKFDIRIKGIKHISHTFSRIDLADNINLTEYAMQPGDIANGEGRVDNVIDLSDLKILEDLIKSQPSSAELSRADLNFDGALDVLDRALLRSGLRNEGQ